MTVESRHIEDQEGTRLVIEGGADGNAKAVGRAGETITGTTAIFQHAYQEEVSSAS